MLLFTGTDGVSMAEENMRPVIPLSAADEEEEDEASLAEGSIMENC